MKSVRLKYKPVLLLIGLFALAMQTPAQFNRTALLIDAPTADVLPYGSLAISPKITFPLVNTRMSYNHPELDASIRFSPLNRLELALTAYTLKDYVLGAQYQLVSGKKEGTDEESFSLALGIHDIGIHSYVSPIGHDTFAWPEWRYHGRPKENFSAYIVGTIPIAGFARLHLGLGRGRYVGYSRGKYINTDIFFGDERHQWAIGLFGGAEINLGKYIALCGDVTGRDVSAGVKGFIGPFTISLAGTKLEGFTPKEPDARFGRLAFAVSYQTGNLLKPRPPKPPAPLPPPPPPVPEEEVVEEKVKPIEMLTAALKPIYFDFDKSDIRPGDAEILKGNANVIQKAIKEGQK
ncbi:MAG: hypothetical protein ABIK39_00005, partial [candidate division WOR-3 bacterium]